MTNSIPLSNQSLHFEGSFDFVYPVKTSNHSCNSSFPNLFPFMYAEISLGSMQLTGYHSSYPPPFQQSHHKILPLKVPTALASHHSAMEAFYPASHLFHEQHKNFACPSVHKSIHKSASRSCSCVFRAFHCRLLHSSFFLSI